MIWKRDLGLTLRIWLTFFLLFVVYLVFLAVLWYLGIGFSFLILMVVAIAFLQYYFSDKLVLWTTGARVVEPDEYPDLHRMVEGLCNQAGLPKPKIAIMQSPVPNAFATGKGPHSAVVAVTDSILRLLSPKELEAVLAHELSHVRNRDMLTLTLASFISMIAAILMQSFLFSGLFGGRGRDGETPWIIVGIVSIVVYFVSNLLIMALSRYREYAADRGSALITRNPQALISALAKISGRMEYLPPEVKAKVEGANAFFIIPALSGNTILELFATHPPIEKRVAALEAIESELRGY
jgi:heat shock protein HtpX